MSYFRAFYVLVMLSPVVSWAKFESFMWADGAPVGCEARLATESYVAKVQKPGEAPFYYVREERKTAFGNRIVIHSRKESLDDLRKLLPTLPALPVLPQLSVDVWTRNLMDPQEAAFAKYRRRHWPADFIEDLRDQALKNLDRSTVIESFSSDGKRLGSLRLISAEFVYSEAGVERRVVSYRPLPEEEILKIRLQQQGVIVSAVGDPVQLSKGINSEVSSYFIEEGLDHTAQARVHAELWVTMLERLNGPGLSLINRHGHRLHTYADAPGLKLYRPWGFRFATFEREDKAVEAKVTLETKKIVEAYGVSWKPIAIGWDSLDNLKHRLARSLHLDRYEDIDAGQGELDEPTTWMRRFREFPEIDLDKDSARAEEALMFYTKWLARRDSVESAFALQYAGADQMPWLEDYLEVKTSLEVIRLGTGQWLTSMPISEAGRRKFRLRVLVAAIQSEEGQNMIGDGTFAGPWIPLMQSVKLGQEDELRYAFVLLRAIYLRQGLLTAMGGLLDMDTPRRFGPPPRDSTGTLREQVRELKKRSDESLVERGITRQQRAQWQKLFDGVVGDDFEFGFEKFKELFVSELERDHVLIRDFLRTIVDISFEDWRP